MLVLLRKKAQSPTIQITILIIILVFVFWGVGTNRGNKRNVVAMVDDTPVSYSELSRKYDRVLTEQREKFGGKIPEDLLTKLISKQQVLEQLIQGILLHAAAQESGIRVTDEEVRRTVQGMSIFSANGSFNLDRYRRVLAGSRLTPADYESGLKSDLLNQKILDSLNRFAKVPQDLLKERFAYDYEEITLEYIELDGDNFKNKVKVEDEALAVFFDKHRNKYKTAPQVKLSYLSFPYANKTGISDDEINIYYQQNLSNYVLPEKRQARHILIRVKKNADPDTIYKKRTEAEKIMARAKKGENFAALAKKYSEDQGSAQRGGDLGFFGKGQMVKPFDDAVFSMKQGEISEPVRTQYGFHIIQLEKIEPARTRKLADVKDEIKRNLLQEKGKSLAFKKASQAYEKIILTGSMEKFAAAENIKVSKTGYFTKKSPPSELAGDQVFLNSAFGLKKGDLSSIVETREGFVILFVDDHKEPEIPTLKAVRNEVRKDFIADQATISAKAAAEKLLKDLKQGGDFKQEAKKLGIKVTKTAKMSRATKSKAKLPEGVVTAAFRLTMKNPYPDKIGAGADKYYVFRLTGSKEPTPELFDKKKDELQQKLLQQTKVGLLTDWLAYLRDRADITVNEQLLQ